MLAPDVIWSATLFDQAIPLLARQAAYLSADEKTTILPFPENDTTQETVSQWLDMAAIQMGLEFQSIETNYPDLETMLAQGGPAILQIAGKPDQYLMLIRGNRHTLTLLGKNAELHKLPLTQVRDVLAAELETPLISTIQEMLNNSGIQQQRHSVVMASLLREQLSDKRIHSGWLLRLSPADSFLKQLRHAQVPVQIGWIFATTIIAQALMLYAWVVIGKSLFQADIESSDLQLWALLLLTSVPFQLMSLQTKNNLSMNFGSLLRNRLLHGILQLNPEEIRHQGSGSFLGQVMDIELLEASGLSLAFVSLMAMVELLIAVVVLMSGAGGVLHGLLLLGWVSGVLWLGKIYYARLRDWINHYQLMTCDLVELMVGHRTRLVQESLKQRHQKEDTLLSDYVQLSLKLDNIKSSMSVFAGRRGWLVVGLLGLVPVFFSAQTELTQLAISIGGVLLAATALDTLIQNMSHYLEAMISWENLRPLYNASKRESDKKPTEFISPAQLKRQAENHPIIEAQNLCFSHNAASRLILEHCNLRIEQGQHLLLEGSSGGGKSTLATLLSGLRSPKSGHLRLFGLSLDTLGEDAWRRRVVIAPQFHENYVITETFAFNLLMGRCWPPSFEDLMEAESICYELNLGELLETMPAGLQQMVGDGGWRLSHGERSRLFIARTLLQKADLIILDESFAALDANTLQIALSCVLRRSNALLVIAHP